MGVGDGGEDGLAEAAGEKRDSMFFNIVAPLTDWKERNQSGFVWLRKLLDHVRQKRAEQLEADQMPVYHNNADVDERCYCRKSCSDVKMCTLLHTLAQPSALGPSTSGGTFTTPISSTDLTASTSGPSFVLYYVNQTFETHTINILQQLIKISTQNRSGFSIHLFEPGQTVRA